MHKVVFIENRHKTELWEKIGIGLDRVGYKVEVLVQNPLFKPSSLDSFVIPFPKSYDIKSSSEARFLSLAKKDRGAKHFGAGVGHYSYYYQQIVGFLEKEKPVCVFGESTLFHELLVIEACKELEIVFLHPTSCRYPAGRMSFFVFDTLIPFNEKTRIDVEEKDRILAKKIAQRNVTPDYMSAGVAPSRLRFLKISSAIRLMMSYLLGERYNTPSPYRKLLLRHQLKRRYSVWENLSVSELSTINNWSRVLVFPLQMQPEANLDVWGFPYNDQAKLIHRILEMLPNDWQLLVKPNPKSKFELTEELFSAVKADKRVVPLSHTVKMEPLFERAENFVSVTGTVCFECIFASKRGYSPALPHVKYFSPGTYGLPTFEGDKKKDDPDAPAKLIAYLRSNSYDGLISDHFHSDYVYSESNISSLEFAFSSVLKEIVRSSGYRGQKIENE